MPSKINIEELIEKLAENKANPEELRELFRALRADENIDSDILPYLLSEEIDEIGSSADSQTIWSKIESRISPVSSKRRFWQLPLVRVAASVVLLIIAGLAVGKIYQTFSWVEYSTEVGEIRTFHLDDGSAIVLNGNSRLKVRRNLSPDKPREVFLIGEASFQVTKAQTDEARFVVHTKDLDVEVLGTRFNVNSRDLETVVYLEEGSVKVGRKDQMDQDVYLKPGEKVEYHSSDQQLKRTEVKSEVNEISWREGVFEFEDLTLDKILKQITGSYDYNYDIESPNLRDRTFTVRIPDNNLDFALSVLEKLTGTSIIDQSGTLVVREADSTLNDQPN